MKNKEYLSIGIVGTILIYLFFAFISHSIDLNNFKYIDLFMPLLGIWWCFITYGIIVLKTYYKK